MPRRGGEKKRAAGNGGSMMNSEEREPWLNPDRDLPQYEAGSPTLKVSTLAQRYNDLSLDGDFDEVGMQKMQQLQALLTDLEMKDLQRQKQLAEFQVRQADHRVLQAGEFEADVGKRKQALHASQDEQASLQQRNHDQSLRLLRLLATRDHMQNESTMLDQERHAADQEMQTLHGQMEHTRQTREQIQMETDAVMKEYEELRHKNQSVNDAEDHFERAKDSEVDIQLEEGIGKQQLQLEKARAEAQFRVVQAEEELAHFQEYMKKSMTKYTRQLADLNEQLRIAKVCHVLS